MTHPETGELVTWEACQTFSGSWGYYRDEQTWKSPEMLIRMLVNTVSCGGNLLMNVVLPPEATWITVPKKRFRYMLTG